MLLIGTVIATAFSSSGGSKPLSPNTQVYAVSINNETTCSGIRELYGQFADQQAAAVAGMNRNIKNGGNGGFAYETASEVASITPLLDGRIKELCG